MSRTVTCLVASFFLYLGASDHSLATNCAAGQSYKVVSESEVQMETVSFEIYRNGEPMEGMDDPGGSSEKRTVVTIDQILEADSGTATKMRRVFETVEGVHTSERRGEQQYDCPLDGLTLELQLEEGEVKVEVVDGEEPDDEQALEGHGFGFDADALLPGEAVSVDQSWELDDDQVRRVLGLEIDRALFPRSAGDGEGRRGGGEGGGRGRRGGGGRGGNAFALMRIAEWEATATLASVGEKHEGENCVRIEFLFEAEGDQPEREFGRGRGRERMFELETVPFNESTYEISIEGFLLFSLDSSLPLQLELEGTISTESNVLRENGEMSLEINSEEAGTFLRKLKVSLQTED
ncbi:MAG: hypothetical protein ACI8TQ_000484 [Planctomycetota bacterium]|jgi:hypothetical protein